MYLSHLHRDLSHLPHIPISVLVIVPIALHLVGNTRIPEEIVRVLEILRLKMPHLLVLIDGELDDNKPHRILVKGLSTTVLCQIMMIALMMKAVTACELIYYSFFVSLCVFMLI